MSKKASVRFTTKAIENIEKYHKGKTFSDSVNMMLESYADPEAMLEKIECDHYNDYPQNPKFMVCTKEARKRVLAIDKCRACKLYNLIKFPLKRIDKLNGQISELERQKETLQSKITTLDDPEKLKLQIAYWKDKYAKAIEEKEQLSKTKPIVEIRKVPEIRDVVREVTVEKEKIVEKLIYKEVQILCPSKTWVSIAEECKMKCEDFLGCPYFTILKVVEST